MSATPLARPAVAESIVAESTVAASTGADPPSLIRRGFGLCHHLWRLCQCRPDPLHCRRRRQWRLRLHHHPGLRRHLDRHPRRIRRRRRRARSGGWSRHGDTLCRKFDPHLWLRRAGHHGAERRWRWRHQSGRVGQSRRIRGLSAVLQRVDPAHLHRHVQLGRHRRQRRQWWFGVGDDPGQRPHLRWRFNGRDGAEHRRWRRSGRFGRRRGLRRQSRRHPDRHAGVHLRHRREECAAEIRLHRVPRRPGRRGR